MRGGRREDPTTGKPLQGRRKGVPDARLTPEATREALDALRLPGESWAALAARIGVPRQRVSEALKEGVTERRLGVWRVRVE